MKNFTQLNEAVINDKNPGNGLDRLVTNHYTPIQNIITNVKNLFAARAGVVVSEGEDGVSLKMTCSKFVSKEAVDKVIYEVFYNENQSLASYIMSQGLDKITLVNIGQYYIVYFNPSDVASATLPGNTFEESKICATKEISNEDAELSYIKESEDEEEELEAEANKKIQDILNDKDKIKAAKALTEIIKKEITDMPENIYFSGVRDKDGTESVALRWKFTKKRPHDKESEITRSVMNIYGTGDDAIWIGDFDEDSIVTLPSDIEDIINNIIDFLGAEKTDNPSVFSFGEKTDDKKDDKKNDKKDDNKEEKKEDEEDVEDSKSRGDNEDDEHGTTASLEDNKLEIK